MPNQEEQNFALEFAKELYKSNLYFNPILTNQHLKNLNMHPINQSRERVQEMINSPQNNEQVLRRLAQFIYNTQMSYKRIVHYLADILTFDWYFTPTNANEVDIKKAGFKKDFDIMNSWFNRFNARKEFGKAMLKICQEDGYFTYLREDSDNDLFLQEIPIDWCLIDSYWKYGYLYSFNMTYFQQAGADINEFPKEFKTYYKNILDMQKNKTYYPNVRPEIRNGRWAYWQQLKPDKAWAFKFHTHFAGLIPPFLGVFLDYLDLPNIKDLQNAKSELEVYKIIMGTVPRNKDNKSGSKADDFAISAESLARFASIVKNSMQNSYVDFKAVPLENLEMFSFDDAANKDDVLHKSLNNISTQTGVDRNIMNTERPNIATMNISKLVDEVFVKRLYEQFADFCTYHINLLTKKYKFKITFHGTVFDQEKRKDDAKNDLTLGLITPKTISNLGMSIHELQLGMAVMDWLGFAEKLTPVQTSHTLSKTANSKAADSKGEAGRPPKKEDELGEKGEGTRTTGSNIEKVVPE